MKRKLLVITSLFPSKTNPSYGSFVKDQVKLLEPFYDIRIIVEQQIEYDKKSFIKSLIHSSKYSHNYFSKRVDHNFDQKNKTYALKYPFFSFFIPVTWQFKLILGIFYGLFDSLISENWKPDLLHAHYLLNSGIIAYNIGKKYKIPFVITEHNPITFNDSSFWITKAKETYLKTTVFIVVSHHELCRFITFNSSKIPEVLFNFVDEDKFYLNNTTSTTFRVLFTGYPHPLKGMNLLFEVIKIIKDQNISNIEFQILTSDNKTCEFPEGISGYILKNNLEKYCRLIDRVEKEQMPGMYNNCDLFLSTSINETFGLSILEALMCGIPVVSTRSGGPSDFLSNENSLSFPINDAVGIANAIIKIKNSEVVFNHSKIRESVVKKFGKASYIEGISSIYAKL